MYRTCKHVAHKGTCPVKPEKFPHCLNEVYRLVSQEVCVSALGFPKPTQHNLLAN